MRSVRALSATSKPDVHCADSDRPENVRSSCHTFRFFRLVDLRARSDQVTATALKCSMQRATQDGVIHIWNAEVGSYSVGREVDVPGIGVHGKPQHPSLPSKRKWKAWKLELGPARD